MIAVQAAIEAAGSARATAPCTLYKLVFDHNIMNTKSTTKIEERFIHDNMIYKNLIFDKNPCE